MESVDQLVWVVWVEELAESWRPSLQGIFATKELAESWIDEYKKSDRYYKTSVIYIDEEYVVNS